MSETDRIYTVYIAGVSYTSTTERFTIVIVETGNSTYKKILPIEIADLADIFN
jgi:hypothetical protein